MRLTIAFALALVVAGVVSISTVAPADITSVPAWSLSRVSSDDALDVEAFFDHGGGLNKCGCHVDRKAGTCHCHQNKGCGCTCQPARCTAPPRHRQ